MTGTPRQHGPNANHDLERRTQEHYEWLAAEADRNLDRLEAKDPVHEVTLDDVLRRRGLSRRDFLKMSAVMTATLGLPPMFDLRVARAQEVATRLPVIWQELQSCSGNSMALIRNANPGTDELLLDLISLEYAGILMAPAGQAAEDVLAAAIERYDGAYIAVFEGSVPVGNDGNFLTIGPAGETGVEKVEHIAKHAGAVIAAARAPPTAGSPPRAPIPRPRRGSPTFSAREGSASWS